MIRFLKKNINLTVISSIRSFAGNRFKNPKFVDKRKELKNLKKRELTEFESMKADVERFRADFWRKHDKKYYFGAYTFILHKQKEIKEVTNKEIDYDEEEEKESQSGKL